MTVDPNIIWLAGIIESVRVLCWVVGIFSLILLIILGVIYGITSDHGEDTTPVLRWIFVVLALISLSIFLLIMLPSDPKLSIALMESHK